MRKRYQSVPIYDYLDTDGGVDGGEKCSRVDRATFDSPSGKSVDCANWCSAYYLSQPPTIMQFGTSTDYFENIKWEKSIPVERFEISPWTPSRKINDEIGELVWDPVRKLYISANRLRENQVVLTPHQVADLPYWFQGGVYPSKKYKIPRGVFVYVQFPEFKGGLWGGKMKN